MPIATERLQPAGEMAVAHLDGCDCPECAPPDPAIAARERHAPDPDRGWDSDGGVQTGPKYYLPT